MGDGRAGRGGKWRGRGVRAGGSKEQSERCLRFYSLRQNRIYYFKWAL